MRRVASTQPFLDCPTKPPVLTRASISGRRILPINNRCRKHSSGSGFERFTDLRRVDLLSVAHGHFRNQAVNRTVRGVDSGLVTFVAAIRTAGRVRAAARRVAAVRVAVREQHGV